jgi:hypothetical protein
VKKTTVIRHEKVSKDGSTARLRMENRAQDICLSRHGSCRWAVGSGRWAVGGIYGRMDESGEMRFKV